MKRRAGIRDSGKEEVKTWLCAVTPTLNQIAAVGIRAVTARHDVPLWQPQHSATAYSTLIGDCDLHFLSRYVWV